MAYIVIAYIVMAYTVMADIIMAYIVMAYTVMACIVMAYTVMAYIGLHSYGLYKTHRRRVRIETVGLRARKFMRTCDMRAGVCTHNGSMYGGRGGEEDYRGSKTRPVRSRFNKQQLEPY